MSEHKDIDTRPISASVDDDTLDRMNAPVRVRRCTTHHACDCLGWMAAQYRKGFDGLDDGMNPSTQLAQETAATGAGLTDDDALCQVDGCNKPHQWFTNPGLYLCTEHSEYVLAARSAAGEAAPPSLGVDALDYGDLLDVASALLKRYPPDTIVCSHHPQADIGARSTAAIADLVESIRETIRLAAQEQERP